MKRLLFGQKNSHTKKLVSTKKAKSQSPISFKKIEPYSKPKNYLIHHKMEDDFLGRSVSIYPRSS